MVENKISKTMYAVAYIRSKQLNDKQARELIRGNEKEGKAIVDYIDSVNGGMFTANVLTRNYYFRKQLEENQEIFEQLIILGVGLDTKPDTMGVLKSKQVFGIDICAESIKEVYREADISTKITFIPYDLMCNESNFAEELEKYGVSTTKKTFIIWEGGTFYLSPDKIKSVVKMFTTHLTITGISMDCLNKEVFFNPDHPLREVIDTILGFLASGKEPWLGFLTKKEIEFLSEIGFDSIEIEDHGKVERNINPEPVMVEDLNFFITAVKKS